MSKFRKKPVVIESTRWFKNGDHPADAIKQIRNADGEPFDSEGEVVRYYRTQDLDGQHACVNCGRLMHDHGWVETLEGGHTVCPGDWIITGIKGEHYPCKPDIFEATHEAVSEN